MKSFVLRRLKKTSAIRRTLAMFMVIALSFTMLSVDALAAKKVAKKAATKINVSSKKLYVGQTLTLKLTNGKKTIKATKATTSAKNNAAVSFNKKYGTAKVTAKKARKAAVVITLYNKKKAYKCRVTVINTKINKSAVTITEGKTYQLKLTGTGIKSVKTSNKKIATVNSKGLVKGVKAGSVTVTLTGKNNVKHNCKVTVKAKTVKVTGVKLSTTTPKVGDTITATATPANANNIAGYSWVRTDGTTEKVIPGETATSYKVSSIDVGYFLYAVVKDKSNNKFQSKTTARIQAQTIKGVSITGLSGKIAKTDKKENLAVIGDKLEAKVTPEGAKDLVTYQWYRGSSPITGATNATYTVTDDDWKNELKVKVTAVDSQAVSFETASASECVLENAVVKPISATTAKLSSTKVTNGSQIGVVIKEGSNTLEFNTAYTLNWYRDKVDTENVIGTGATYNCGAEDIGHAIIAEVTAKDPATTNYCGSFTLSTEKASGTLSNVTLVKEGATAGVGTVLTAILGDGETGETAEYTFYKNGVVIQNGSSNTYTFTTDDVSNTDQTFKVVATGTGAYTGSTSTDDEVISAVSAKPVIEGFKLYKGTAQVFSTADGGNLPIQNIAIGDTLTVKAVSAIGNSYLHVDWYKSKNTNIGTAGTAGDHVCMAHDTLSYTIPTDWTESSKLVVVSYYTTEEGNTVDINGNANLLTGYDRATTTSVATGVGNDFGTSTSGDFFVRRYENSSGTTVGLTTGSAVDKFAYVLDVGKSLTEANVKYDNSATANSAMVGYKTFTTPEVGAYAHVAFKPSGASADCQWYVDKAKDGYEIVESGAEQHQIANGIADDANGAGNTANLKITDNMIGHKLICKVSGTSSYLGSVIETTPSTAVVPSSRTIKEIKVVEGTPSIATKTAFDSATAATTLTAGTTYKVFALASDDTVISGANGVTYRWDGSKSSTYLAGTDSSNQTWPAVAGKGTISVTVTPDGKNYTGNAKSYTFNTEVSGGSTSTTTGNFLFTTNAATVNTTATGTTVATAGTEKVYTSTGASYLKVTVSNIAEGAAISSYKWYGKESSTTTPVAVGVESTESGEARQFSITDADNELSDPDGSGVQYYVVVTDSLGNTYTSPCVELTDPVATIVENTTNNTTSSGTALDIEDQFGVDITLGASVTIAPTKVSGDGTATSIGGSIATDGTITLSGLTNVADGDQFTCTYLGKTITFVSTGASMASWTYGVASAQW